ncbi:MAG: nucleotidyl transferase AbiEii/AbiGii toxin family protein [Actinomycetota bacterium]
MFGLPEAADYALAGGAALLATGTITRPTRDLDAFVEAQPAHPPGDVAPLTEALTRTLGAEGWSSHVVRSHQTFTRLLVSKEEHSVEIDLAVDSPRLFPLTVVAGIPMLDTRDLAARKILAAVDRAEGRDFTDLEALQRHHERSDIVRWAYQLDAGLARAVIADAFSKIDRLDDIDLPSTDTSATRKLFATWATELGS